MVDQSERMLRDRERLLLAIEVLGVTALKDHTPLARRVRRHDAHGWSQVLDALLEQGTSHGWRDREWWRKESAITGTDWSSLLRQRVRALWWHRAGCPPVSEWVRTVDGAGAAAEQAGVGELYFDGERWRDLHGDDVEVP